MLIAKADPQRGEGPELGVALLSGREGEGRRFAFLPRRCSQVWVTNAGQTKQTPDITPFPICPVCFPGQGLLGHPGGCLPVWGEEHLSSGRGPPTPS